MAEHTHESSGSGHFHPYLLAASGIAGAVTLAPYVLPMFGVNNSGNIEDIMHSIGGHAVVDASGAVSSYGTGLAGMIAEGIAHIPLIGEALTSTGPVTIPGLGWTVTAGAMTTLAATAGIGIGGVLLANWMEKRESPQAKIHWSKIIRYAALATSALIALPSILSGISAGIAFLSLAIGGYSAANQAILGLQSTLGATSMAGDVASSLAGMALPHLLTCGSALFPAAASFLLVKDKENKPANAQDFAVAIRVDKPLQLNKPCNARVILTHNNGQPLTSEELALVHTKKLHLLVADSSLRDYQHIHPEPTEEPGVFSCSFTPNTGNNYSAWADFTTAQNGTNYKIKTEIPSQSGRNIKPSIRQNSHAENGGLSFDWKSSESLQKGAAAIVEVTIRDAKGNPVSDLEPVMGAFAHLVGFSSDGESIIHSHPLGAEPKNEHSRGGPRLRFHVEPDSAGATQFYLQVKRGGQDVYVPFGQQIKQEQAIAQREHGHQHNEYTLAGYAR